MQNLELPDPDSFSPISGYNDETSFFFAAMEPGISKMALLEMTKKLREFTRISEKCVVGLNNLKQGYDEAQEEMDKVYLDYKRQIDEAHKKSREMLHSFVIKKQEKL